MLVVVHHQPGPEPLVNILGRENALAFFPFLLLFTTYQAFLLPEIHLLRESRIESRPQMRTSAKGQCLL